MAATGLTIAYVTNRKEPMMNWFFRSLLNQLKTDVHIEILVIDYFAEDTVLPDFIAHELPIRHLSPLPSFCQGKDRITKEIYFDASIARNTAFVYSKYDYIAFVDDVSILLPTWLDAVLEGMRKNEILLGTYQKHSKMVVEWGELKSSEYNPKDGDSRWGRHRLVKSFAPASEFYGCSFAIPLEKALQINGFDAMQAMTGYEDCVFGIRLEKSGNTFQYDKRMATVESLEHHHVDVPMIRFDPKKETRDEYFEVLNRFNVHATTYSGSFNYDSSHAIIDVARLSKDHRSYCNTFDLRKLRDIAKERMIEKEDMNFPDRFWFDEKPLIQY